ncbi:metal ABC transporter permease [soil metagenome]
MVVISALRRGTRVKEDAAIGIVLSVFFGAGIVLSRVVQNRPGIGSRAGLDSYILGKTAGIILQDVLILGAVSLLSLIVVVLLFKEFRLTVFDPDFAGVQGWPVLSLDLLLMGLVALAVVFGLPAVGVVLMAAMLILPGAAARFWTDRLGRLLVLASAFGLLTGVIGTSLSARYAGLPAGPMLVLIGATILLGSVLLAPRRGALARILARRRFRQDLAERNLLRLLFDLTEPHLPVVVPLAEAAVLGRKSWPRDRVSGLISKALKAGHVRILSEGPELRYQLTDSGLVRAAVLARGQRLWERFLTEYPDLAPSMADLASESVEEFLPPEIVEELESPLLAEGRLPTIPKTGAEGGSG